MAREGQGYPCYQRDMMMMMKWFRVLLSNICNSIYQVLLLDTNHLFAQNEMVSSTAMG